MKKILHHIFGHKLLLIAFLSLTLFFSQKNIVFAQLGMFDTCTEIEADQNKPPNQQQCKAIYQMGQEQHACTSARVFLPNVAYCALGSNTDKPGNVIGNTCAAYYKDPPQKCHECGFMLSGTSFYTAYLCPDKCDETGPHYGICTPTSPGACTGTQNVRYDCDSSKNTTQSCTIKVETGPHWGACTAKSNNSCGASGGTQIGTYDCSPNTTSQDCNVNCGNCKLCQNGSCVADPSCGPTTPTPTPVPGGCTDDTWCVIHNSPSICTATETCNKSTGVCSATAYPNGHVCEESYDDQSGTTSPSKWCCSGICGDTNCGGPITTPTPVPGGCSFSATKQVCNSSGQWVDDSSNVCTNISSCSNSGLSCPVPTAPPPPPPTCSSFNHYYIYTDKSHTFKKQCSSFDVSFTQWGPMVTMVGIYGSANWFGGNFDSDGNWITDPNTTIATANPSKCFTNTCDTNNVISNEYNIFWGIEMGNCHEQRTLDDCNDGNVCSNGTCVPNVPTYTVFR
jgi:hypothetical protein